MAAAKGEVRKVLTANNLRDGLVVFFADGNAWSPRLEDAVVVRSAGAASELEARGGAAAKSNLVVGPYLMDVIEDGGRLRAAHIREHLRTLGPSVRLDLGKQAASHEDGPEAAQI
jgi:hypothetical protein